MIAVSESAACLFERERMVEVQLRARGINDPRVLETMRRVPRHLFVPGAYIHDAYEDHPLPIGEGQTISQPYIVAAMLEALALTPDDNVLEVGTGSGYVTALLCELASHVYSIERHAKLLEHARSVLNILGYENSTLRVGDGSLGIPEFAPYDAILVSAAASTMPPELFAQLRENGRMMVPVGPSYAQELQLILKRDGAPIVRRMEGCRFVPLVGALDDAGLE